MKKPLLFISKCLRTVFKRHQLKSTYDFDEHQFLPQDGGVTICTAQCALKHECKAWFMATSLVVLFVMSPVRKEKGSRLKLILKTQ